MKMIYVLGWGTRARASVFLCVSVRAHTQTQTASIKEEIKVTFHVTLLIVSSESRLTVKSPECGSYYVILLLMVSMPP